MNTNNFVTTESIDFALWGYLLIAFHYTQKQAEDNKLFTSVFALDIPKTFD